MKSSCSITYDHITQNFSERKEEREKQGKRKNLKQSEDPTNRERWGVWQKIRLPLLVLVRKKKKGG